MAVVDTLVNSLIPAIAKSVVQHWLSSNSTSANARNPISANLLNLLKRPSPRKRSSQRQVELVAEQLARRLQGVFDHEFALISPESRDAVVYEVAETLSQVKITSEVVVDRGLDTRQLTQYFVDSRPEATKSLSAVEEELYRRILQEVSGEIIGVVTELSGFSNSVMSGIVEKQDQLLEKVTELLLQGDNQLDVFEASYRRAISIELDRMELVGIPQADAITRTQRLSSAYIRLDVQWQTTNQPIKQSEWMDALLKQYGTTSNIGSGTIDQSLTLSRRILVCGDTAAGKTTLLQWIALRSAQRDFSPELGALNNTVPFFLRLRQWIGKQFPAPEEFPGVILGLLSDVVPKGWVHKQLQSGRAIVLIDGIDELPHAQRRDVLGALSQLVASFPLARYIVTSSPAAVRKDQSPEWDNWMSQEEFLYVTLQPMHPKQIDQFVNRWYAALAESQNIHMQVNHLQDAATRLQRLLRQRPMLLQLATNPLLCAIICSLYRDRGSSLPAERIMLYEQCVESLISSRDAARQVPLGPEYPHLSYSQYRALIEDFAYWMMVNGYSDVETLEVDEFFERKLPSLYSTSSISGRDVRSFFIERTGLLREPVIGYIHFTHRTFQEYLGAHAALDNGDIGLLIRNSNDDQWRELIILAAGLARWKDRERLIKGLIERGNRAPRRKHYLHLLALACLETCVEISPELRRMVLDYAAKQFPPKNMDEAKQVAAGGDLAVSFLQANPNLTEEEAAACVRALSLIGTELAQKTLEGYKYDNRTAIVLELERAHKLLRF